jgi:hypothetical protein
MKLALDVATSPPALAAAQAHLGRLANSGGWDDSDALTPLKRFADMFSGRGLRGLDGTAWYHPLRLTIDAGAVANGRVNAAQKELGVRATRGRSLPRGLRMYAFAAGLGGTRALDATRALARRAGIPRRQLVLADRRRTYAYNEPNSARPDRNEFLRRLVPFLRGIARH